MARLRRRGFARYAVLVIGSVLTLVGMLLLPLCTHGSGVTIGLPGGESVLYLYRAAPIGWIQDYRMAPTPGVYYRRLRAMAYGYSADAYSLRVGDAVYEVHRYRRLW